MTDIIEKPSTDIACATQAEQTFALLQQAITAGTSPETLEKLVALQERIMSHDARAQFVRALSQFQAQCPAIVKRKTVKDRSGRLLYAYAPLEDIVATVRPLLADLGLSYSFDSDTDENGKITVTCTIRHEAGHEERTVVAIPNTQGHNTNAAQNAGIALTYGQRYAFCGALGITTADEDQDGNSEKLKPITAEQAADLIALVIETGSDLDKFLAYLRVDKIEEIPAGDYERAVSALEAKRKRGTA
jgi:hypothetical protein